MRKIKTDDTTQTPGFDRHKRYNLTYNSGQTQPKLMNGAVWNDHLSNCQGKVS